jgi:hypothetical protein
MPWHTIVKQSQQSQHGQNQLSQAGCNYARPSAVLHQHHRGSQESSLKASHSRRDLRCLPACLPALRVQEIPIGEDYTAPGLTVNKRPSLPGLPTPSRLCEDSRFQSDFICARITDKQHTSRCNTKHFSCSEAASVCGRALRKDGCISLCRVSLTLTCW